MAKQARLRRGRPPDHGQPQPPPGATPVRSIPPENEGHGVERSDEVGSPDPSNANKPTQEKQGRQCSTEGSLAKKRAQPPSRHRGPEHQTNQWSHYRLVLNTELNTVSSRLFFGHDRGLENISQSPLQRKGQVSQALYRRRLYKGATYHRRSRGPYTEIMHELSIMDNNNDN